MPDRDDKLRQAILGALPIDPERDDTLIGFDVPAVLWQKYTPAPSRFPPSPNPSTGMRCAPAAA